MGATLQSSAYAMPVYIVGADGEVSNLSAVFTLTASGYRRVTAAIFKVQSWTQDGGNYTGAVIKVWRAQTIPTNLVSLLLGGVFNLFASSVVGTQFSVIAVARSDV